eukprot:TRINITY_DN7663_c0_g1_i1.p1 TRINITY_DN7663_c0_g1~~TRINITY_DN7663_c0_g1_i1.p1  ORF type:complete len:293 (-),score=59.25 TRINITY_DN7663_c0_g1_i1:60-890(-)
MGAGASREEESLLQLVPKQLIQPQSFYYKKSEKSALLGSNFMPTFTGSRSDGPRDVVGLGWKEAIIHLFYSRDVSNPTQSILCLLFYEQYDSLAPFAVADLGVLGVLTASDNEIGTQYKHSYTFVAAQGLAPRLGPAEVKIGWSSSQALDEFIQAVLQKQMVFDHLVVNADNHLRRIRDRLKGGREKDDGEMEKTLARPPPPSRSEPRVEIGVYAQDMPFPKPNPTPALCSYDSHSEYSDPSGGTMGVYDVGNGGHQPKYGVFPPPLGDMDRYQLD